MKYRDILGFSQKQPKKKVVPVQPKPSVADVLKEEFGDTINEGPAGEYAKEYQKVKHTYAQFWDAVQDFEDLLNNKGLRRHSKELNRQWKSAEKFYKFFFKMVNKLL